MIQNIQSMAVLTYPKKKLLFVADGKGVDLESYDAPAFLVKSFWVTLNEDLLKT